jgi:hypothetical protein
VQVALFAVDQLTAAGTGRWGLGIQLSEKFGNLVEQATSVMLSAGPLYMVMLFFAQAAASMWAMAICRFAESLASVTVRRTEWT